MLVARLLLLLVPPALACTSIMVGPGASADGTAWVGQSDDGEGAGDARLVWVPPMDWPAGSQRPVLDYEDYPRYVGSERQVPAYFPSARLPNKTANVIGHSTPPRAKASESHRAAGFPTTGSPPGLTHPHPSARSSAGQPHLRLLRGGLYAPRSLNSWSCA